jgi:rubredoxin
MHGWLAIDDMAAGREALGGAAGGVWRTHFLKPEPGTRAPQAFQIDYAPGRVLRTHFHDVDEFQVVVAGSGTLGRHALVPMSVHFARAFTAYGPIVAGPAGLSFLTLRAQRDSAGPQGLHDKRDALLQVPGRAPWQACDQAHLAHGGTVLSVAALTHLAGPAGLSADMVHVPAGAAYRHTPPASGGGQYAVLLEGALRLATRRVGATALAFMAPGDQAFEVRGGTHGAHLLVLGFPGAGDGETRSHALAAAAAAGPHWACTLCGFEYHPALGQPEHGIAAGTAWNDLPADWRCNDCDAPKADFVHAAG